MSTVAFADARLCHTAMGEIRRFYTTPAGDFIYKEVSDLDPALLCAPALYASAMGMPCPPRALFDPVSTEGWYSEEQCRQARASLWNVITMVRAGWPTDWMRRWIASGAKADIPGYVSEDPAIAANQDTG